MKRKASTPKRQPKPFPRTFHVSLVMKTITNVAINGGTAEKLASLHRSRNLPAEPPHWRTRLRLRSTVAIVATATRVGASLSHRRSAGTFDLDARFLSATIERITRPWARDCP